MRSVDEHRPEVTMQDWLTAHKIPLGKWIASFVDFLNEHAAFAFNATSDGLGFLIDGLIDLMHATPPLLLVAIFAAVAYWLHRSIGLVALIVVSLLLIMNLGYWAETIETLALVIFATGLCMLIGVPIGIAAAHRPWLYTAIRPILDLMQTIPTFVYLIPALVGAGGLGKPVVRALNTVNIAQGFEAGLAIVLVAILLDRVCKQRGAPHAGG
jgi:glycine betaine/proline transport system permease protein